MWIYEKGECGNFLGCLDIKTNSHAGQALIIHKNIPASEYFY
jgi:hypothetical protein